MTGFAQGTNLTSDSAALGMCQDTLSTKMIMNFETFLVNFFSLTPENWFTGLFALWSTFYFSEPLVNECTMLYNTM